jgi:hypothetical protein
MLRARTQSAGYPARGSGLIAPAYVFVHGSSQIVFVHGSSQIDGFTSPLARLNLQVDRFGVEDYVVIVPHSKVLPQDVGELTLARDRARR